MTNILYIASAGSGKTQHIINSLKNNKKRILILTYTIKNAEQIKRRIKSQYGQISDNIIIKNWVTFLLHELVRPYQGSLCSKLKRIRGIDFSNKHPFIFKKENPFYFINSQNLIYNNRLSSCVIKIIEDSKKVPIFRLEKMYDYIYIDEAQDLAGYDFDIIDYLLNSKISVFMYMDPRQKTYSTHHEQKNKKFLTIFDYLKNKKQNNINFDCETLRTNYRNSKTICELSNQLFSEYTASESFNENSLDKTHGLFYIEKNEANLFLDKYPSMQLRWSSRTKVNCNYEVLSFGESKGLEFDSVLIYPTQNMWKWFNNHNFQLEALTKSKLYVAITRARYRVVVVKLGKECYLNKFDLS